MTVYITRTGSFLPGPAVDNEDIHRYLGVVPGEESVRERVLRMNGIQQRHYALTEDQSPTHDIYELAAQAVEECGIRADGCSKVGYLSAGSTHTPLSGPGLSSLLHGTLAERGVLTHSVEVNSNAGICTSAAAALHNAYRALDRGEHEAAICVGAERPSEVLKSTGFQGGDAPESEEERQDRRSPWFMSVFLRFMLSDGAGAFLLENQPSDSGISFGINWMFARSFAHEAPLCMTMDNRNMLLSQDVDILSKHMIPCTRTFVEMAMEHHRETLCSYDFILPHMSSFFFQRQMERLMNTLRVDKQKKIPYWTNLATAGNTGAASIFIMLDEFVRTQRIEDGDRVLLFVPESGRFNYVLCSLTAVAGSP